MSLAAVQQVMTRSMRDAQFRTRLATEPDDALQAYDLDRHERELIRSIDAPELEGIARFVLRQRIERRQAEFGLFVNLLDAYVELPGFFRDYHQWASTGQFSRLEEARRFCDFSLAIIARNRLPEHLTDVLRFCLHVLELAETPKVREPGTEVADRSVTASSTVALREPYDVVDFRYDVLLLAREDEAYTERPLPRPCRLLVQRDWRQPKRCRTFPLTSEPVIAALAAGPVTVLDLVGRLPDFTSAEVVGEVRRLHDRGIAHVLPPRELSSRATAPEKEGGHGL